MFLEEGSKVEAQACKADCQDAGQAKHRGLK